MSRNVLRRRFLAFVAPVLMVFVLSQAASAASYPADLTSFSARPVRDQVVIEWTMSREFETAFYRCYRSRAADDEGEVIYTVAASGSVGSAHYSTTDRPPAPGAYYYWLEEVDSSGFFMLYYGPVRAFVGQTWVYAPVAGRD